MTDKIFRTIIKCPDCKAVFISNMGLLWYSDQLKLKCFECNAEFLAGVGTEEVEVRDG